MNRLLKFNEMNNRNFHELTWWIEDLYEWDYVETEGSDRVRFDWNNGRFSMWLNSDLSIDGNVPFDIEDKLSEIGIKNKRLK